MTASPFSAEARDNLARVFSQIASDAGVAVMEVYNSDFETRQKADSSPVSDADELAEEIILAGLARELPDIPVLAEEQASQDGLNRKLGNLFLLVDPVDGTREFIRKKTDFTVNIALIENQRPIAGCVFAPARKEMYVGGATAWLQENFEPGTKVSSAPSQPLQTRAYPASGLTAVASASHLDDSTQAFLNAMHIETRMSVGSSLKFCMVAAGKADIYPRYGPTMEWDTAAGHAVLSAAGGCVLTPEGEPFLYGLHEAKYLNGPFVAWGKTVIEAQTA